MVKFISWHGQWALVEMVIDNGTLMRSFGGDKCASIARPRYVRFMCAEGEANRTWLLVIGRVNKQLYSQVRGWNKGKRSCNLVVIKFMGFLPDLWNTAWTAVWAKYRLVRTVACCCQPLRRWVGIICGWRCLIWELLAEKKRNASISDGKMEKTVL